MKASPRRMPHVAPPLCDYRLKGVNTKKVCLHNGQLTISGRLAVVFSKVEQRGQRPIVLFRNGLWLACARSHRLSASLRNGTKGTNGSYDGLGGILLKNGIVLPPD